MMHAAGLTGFTQWLNYLNYQVQTFELKVSSVHCCQTGSRKTSSRRSHKEVINTV